MLNLAHAQTFCRGVPLLRQSWMRSPGESTSPQPARRLPNFNFKRAASKQRLRRFSSFFVITQQRIRHKTGLCVVGFDATAKVSFQACAPRHFWAFLTSGPRCRGRRSTVFAGLPIFLQRSHNQIVGSLPCAHKAQEIACQPVSHRESVRIFYSLKNSKTTVF